MIKRRYFARAVIYNNSQTISKFTHSVFTRFSLLNQSHIAYSDYVKEVKEYAKEYKCENYQIKAFNRI